MENLKERTLTEHDQQSSGVEVAANVQPSRGRRRLVKGMVIGVPAILTVRRGFAGGYGSLTNPKNICSSDSFIKWRDDGEDPNDMPLSLKSFLDSGGVLNCDP